MLRNFILLTFSLLLTGVHGASAQTAQLKEAVKARLSTQVCDCLTKKSAVEKPESLSKDQVQRVFVECFGAAAGKEMKAIQQAYGQASFSDKTIMRTMGEETGAILVQNCPVSMGYFIAMAKEGSDTKSAAATTGQTVGTLGSLNSTGVAQLEVQVSKTEKTSFVWLRHFEQADDLLRRLPQLKGQQARVSWEEVELLQPDTRQYQKVREITSIELL